MKEEKFEMKLEFTCDSMKVKEKLSILDNFNCLF